MCCRAARRSAKARRNRYAPTPRWSKPIWGCTVRRRPIVLSIETVTSAYGRIEVLHGVTLRVEPGEIVTLIGANGAGKTTLLRAISGVQPITHGTIRFPGTPLENLPAHDRADLDLSQVSKGHRGS